MEPITSVLWDVFKNVLGNRVDAFLFGEAKSVASGKGEDEADEIYDNSPRANRRFKTFDAIYDLQKILEYVDNPIVYLLVEDSPTTAYNLPCYVIESATTHEWFVFSRGRLALQGNGGGHNNIEEVFSTLLAKKAKIGAWVASKHLLDRLELGQQLWPDIKHQSVPLLAYLSEEYSWPEIQNQFRKLSGHKVL